MMRMRYMLPEKHELRQIRQAVDRGVSVTRIAEAVLRNPNRANVVVSYLREKELYDPEVDEVAVERALAGDRQVWLNLTYKERAEVLLRSTNVGPEIWRDVWEIRSSGHLAAMRTTLRRFGT